MEDKTEVLKKYFSVILMGGLVILVLSAIVGVIVAGFVILKNQSHPPVAPPPPAPITTTPPPPPPPFGIPKFATDSAVLQLQESLLKFRQEIETTDYFELQISSPTLDSRIHAE